MANRVREGSDVTIVGVAGGVQHAIDAANALEPEGISVEVIDPRTLVPLDTDTILESVEKTSRLVVVDPAHKMCSAGSEIAAIVLPGNPSSAPMSFSIEDRQYIAVSIAGQPAPELVVYALP